MENHGRALGVFLRPPVPGRCKTRLAAGIGATAAAAVYRACVDHLATTWQASGAAVVLFVDAADGADDVRHWLRDYPVRVQATGSLGERLFQATNVLFDEGYDSVCLTGTDAPLAEGSYLATIFDALGGHDLAVGPAYDGGYTCIAMRKPIATVFADIAWSTPRVLEQTLMAAAAAGLTMAVGTPLSDIDTEDDLRSFLVVHASHPLAVTIERLLAQRVDVGAAPDIRG